MFRDFLGDAHASMAARGAIGEIDAGELDQLVLCCFRFWIGDGGGNTEEIPAASEIFLFGAAGEETGVTDAFEGGGDGMQQESDRKSTRLNSSH